MKGRPEVRMMDRWTGRLRYYCQATWRGSKVRSAGVLPSTQWFYGPVAVFYRGISEFHKTCEYTALLGPLPHRNCDARRFGGSGTGAVQLRPLAGPPNVMPCATV